MTLLRPTGRVQPLAEMLRSFIGHDRTKDYTVRHERCPFCQHAAETVNAVFVEQLNKWSGQRICEVCRGFVQRRTPDWLEANFSPIFCNSEDLAARFARRHARKRTEVVVELRSYGAAR